MSGKAVLVTWIIRVVLTLILYFGTRAASTGLDYILQFFEMPNWALFLIRLLFTIILIIIILPILRWIVQFFKGKGIYLDRFDW